MRPAACFDYPLAFPDGQSRHQMWADQVSDVARVVKLCVAAMQVFASPLQGGDRAVCFFHRSPRGGAASVQLPFSKLGYPDAMPVVVRELFEERDWHDLITGRLTVSVPVDSVVLLRLTPTICAKSRREAATGKGRWRRDGAAAIRTQQSDSGQADWHGTAGREECDRFDAWRPWHHGFFGPIPTVAPSGHGVASIA
jgi:Alpha galactosidase C-terminal beta sandwich domain